MTLTPGTRLGVYEITAQIGVGGMGEVYRARDTQLKRDVALKVLPAALATDADRLARFQREAELLAALNHPHIAHIYGFAEAEGVRALVMELVEGPTLADRIAQRAIPIDEALPIATQIAEALEAAHEQAIIHRDLKPANIKLRPDGMVKVLDFGLAKALDVAPSADLSQSPTITTPAQTRVGMIMGTPAYMSPEQARGQLVDKRADIWAFGCVLYEMLTGHLPFDGDDIVDVLGPVARLEPNWETLPIDVPPPIRTLLQSCLLKDRRQRVGDMSVVRFVLEKGASLAPAHAAPAPRPAVPSSPWRGALPLVAALAVGALLAFAGVWFVARPAQTPEAAVYLSTYELPDGLRIPAPPRPGAAGRFALSPDGRRLAFVATDANNRVQLWIRLLDTLTAEALPGTDGASSPFWSPDSRLVAFVAQNTLKKIDVVGGGPPVTLSTSGAEGRGSWSAHGAILFSTDGVSLSQISSSNETSSPATPLDLGQGERAGLPSFLPDGQHFFYTVEHAAGRATEVYVGSLDAQAKGRRLLAEAAGAMYAQDHVIFQRGTTLMAQTFDAERLTLVGDAVPIAERLDVTGGLGSPGAFSVSRSGTLAYQTDGGDVRSQLTWFDRAGRPLGVLGDAADQISVALSPDGARAALSVLDPTRNTRDLWIYEVARGIRTKFTTDPTDELLPVWSPDGGRLAYGSTQKGPVDIYLRNSTGVGVSEVLLDGPGNKYPTSWSRDGFLTYFNGVAQSPRTLQDVWVVPVLGEHTAKAFIQTEASDTYGQYSPDGRWLAYSSGESRQRQIWVAPVPGPGEKVQVSTAGGDNPRWRRDGRELFFLSTNNEMVAAEVDGRAGFVVRDLRTLFPTRVRTVAKTPAGYQYDVSKDGQQFLINSSIAQTGTAPITLLVNWIAGLKK